MSTSTPQTRRTVCNLRHATTAWRALRRVTVTTMLLALALTSQAKAREWHFDENTTVTNSPTLDKPWIAVKLAYYDEKDNKHSKFMTPVDVFVNNTRLADIGDIVFYNDEQDKTQPRNFAKANKDQWIGTQKTYTVNGRTYTIQLYGAAIEGTSHYTTLYIIPDNIMEGEVLNVRLSGYWQTWTDNKNKRYSTREWKKEVVMESVPRDEWTVEGNAERTEYGKVRLTAKFGSRQTNTTIGTTDGTYDKNVFNGALQWKYLHNSQDGKATLTADCRRMGRTPQMMPLEFYNTKALLLNKKGFKTNVYKWVETPLPTYITATGTKGTPDKWERTVTLRWNCNKETLRSEAGTWAVFRRKNGDSTPERLETGLPRTASSYTDNTPDYDTAYVYYVVFEPENTPDSVFLSALADSTDVLSVPRSFNIDIDSVESRPKSVMLQWHTESYRGRDELLFDIMRADANADVYAWERLENATATRLSPTRYRFEDRSVESCRNYVYKIVAHVFGREFDSGEDNLRTGGSTIQSRVTQFGASKGEYKGKVRLVWHATHTGTTPTRFELSRTVMGSERWSEIYTVSSSDSVLAYDDTAADGTYYNYRIRSITRCGDTERYNDMTSPGFAIATGVVSGRISYGTGTAVQGARVTLTKSDGSSVRPQFAALRVNGSDSGIRLGKTAQQMERLFGERFTMQMYIRPDARSQQDNDSPTFFDLADKIQLELDYTYDSQDTCRVNVKVGGTAHQSAVLLPVQEYSHITITRAADLYTLMAIYKDGSACRAQTTVKTLRFDTDTLGICFGGTYADHENESFCGCIDEMRVYSGVALDSMAIRQQYSHTLSGTESGLVVYWPADEGIAGQDMAFDYSRTNGVANGNHGTIRNCDVTDRQLPEPSQLSLHTLTDEQGNYTIRGIPFSDDGTGYTVIPTLGTHTFSPSQQNMYVSAASLVHSSVNFADQSAFDVSGTVYYEGTSIPSEGCTLLVDGTICSRDGKMVTTDKDGRFTISVPIGNHYIEVRKDGHTFANNGRYPADPDNLTLTDTFEGPRTNMTFADCTLANLTGRIAGGAREMDKPLGAGRSRNNVGQAIVEIEYRGGGSRWLNAKRTATPATGIDPATDNRAVQSQTARIASKAYIASGDSCNTVIITTDPVTGEFSALLPPLEYTVRRVRFGTGNDNNNILKDALDAYAGTIVDLSNTTTAYTDTTMHGDTLTGSYEYAAAMKRVLHSEPVMTVTQNGNPAGAFGIGTYEISDELGTLDAPVYSHDETTGETSYHFGAPVFESLSTYTFRIKAYEQYTNYDAGRDPGTGLYPTDIVPLDGTSVRVSNALGIQQKIYTEGDSTGLVKDLQYDEIVLDSAGLCNYTWRAGLPNITPPYQRGIQIYYDTGEATRQWPKDGPMAGVLIGDMPTGNNFVTRGPEFVDMILRDPPGSKSHASWTKGARRTHYKSFARTWNTEHEDMGVNNIGITLNYVNRTGIIDVMTTTEALDMTEAGMKVVCNGEDGSSWTTTLETQRTISTSADSKYVGPMADLFIGTSTNLLYGNAHRVGIYRDKTDTGKATLEKRDEIAQSLSLNTMFSYTAHYIENELIPELRRIRNAQLVHVDNPESFVNRTDNVVYITTLTPDDPRYGSNNNDTKVWGDKAVKGASSSGASYRAVEPAGGMKRTYVDTIMSLNTSITNWEKLLELNERQKTEAYYNKYPQSLVQNLSFDKGSTVTASETADTINATTYEYTCEGIVHFKTTAGLHVDDRGYTNVFRLDDGGGEHRHTSATDENITTFSYTLADDGDNDALTVDVMKYGGYSPIFRTRAGRTSNPYEGEVRTRYYKDKNGKDKVLMEQTQQIEKPALAVDGLKWAKVAGVPSGGAANYTLQLNNHSATGHDVAYRLYVADSTNTNGALLTIDGTPFTNGRVINVPTSGTVSKQLQLRQTNRSHLQYDSIAVVLASQTQGQPVLSWPAIADTVWVSAVFVPSASNVRMLLDKAVVNTLTGENIDITFNNFDRAYAGQKAFRVQAVTPTSNDWTTLHEYMLHDGDVPEGNSRISLLPEGNDITYTYNMHDSPDGLYRLRILSVSTYGGKEVCTPSNETAINKDMARPRPLTMPQPADGLLGIGTDVCVEYDEDIVKGELGIDTNFEVTGVLNGALVAHHTALAMQGNGCTAQTEADIPLAGRDFAIDFWLKADSPGTILRHGGGASKLTAEITADSCLSIGIGPKTYTSETKVPMGVWTYMSIAYTTGNDSGTLSAAAATDNRTETLFDNRKVELYGGRGTLAVGLNMHGAMHELTLWDEAHTTERALAARSQSKMASTPHLIGYWRMDEGNGRVAADAARRRNMSMTAATWHSQYTNYSALLDGKAHLSIPTAHTALTANDSYAVELWIKADTQPGEAQILQLGTAGLHLDNNGRVVLTSDSAAWTASTAPITDNTWHHLALNVVRQGNAAVYIDGTRTFATAARNIGTPTTDSLLVGAQRTHDTAGKLQWNRILTAQVDEIRLWQATLDATTMADTHRRRLTGNENGLVAYYPFETQTLDEATQPVTAAIDTCVSITGSGLHATYDGTRPTITTDGPALQPKPQEQNVAFHFTANERRIVIAIDESPATIEGRTLHFKVKNLHDTNGNSAAPVCWSATVQRNPIAWRTAATTAQAAVRIETKTGETAQTEAWIVNKSGLRQSWTLGGLPSWLSVSDASGTVEGQGEHSITLAVSASCPTGRHHADIYALSADGIAAVLPIDVTVIGTLPDWKVDPTAYKSSMSVVARLNIEGVPTSDTDDIVAAFVGNECRGVASPIYSARYDDYFVLMDVYGDTGDGTRDVKFSVYDADRDMTLPNVETNIQTTFTANTLCGNYRQPLTLNALNCTEQTLTLGAGWNWTSLAVRPSDMRVESVFGTSDGNIRAVKSKRASAVCDGDVWHGASIVADNTSMYKVNATTAATVTVTGTEPAATERIVTLRPGWNWIAYNLMRPMDVADALAAADPQDGDMVKGKRGFALYDGYEWSGSLTTLYPGEGYIYHSTATEERRFAYPQTAIRLPRTLSRTLRQAVFNPIDDARFAGNMTIVARVTRDGQPVADAEVGVFDDSECRTHEWSDGDGLVFLTVPGDKCVTLRFRVAHNDKIYEPSATMQYEDDGMAGNLRTPVELDLGMPTNGVNGIVCDDDTKTEWYDIDGRRLGRNTPGKGVFIRKSKGKARKTTVGPRHLTTTLRTLPSE